MLPLLPALILLLLNGPANIERLAEGGALPAMLAAIQRKMEAPGSREGALTRKDQLALASLLSMSGDPRVSSALVRILVLGTDQPTAQDGEFPSASEAPEPPPQIDSIGRPHAGHLRSQRSRDGPTTL